MDDDDLDLSLRVACGQVVKGGAKASLSRAKECLQAGALVDSVDEDGWTALMHASGGGNLTIVEWLTMEAHATVDHADSTKCTPLWIACFNNEREVAKHLLRCGADTTIVGTPDGEPAQTPALAARRQRHPGLADLIDAEAALRAADSTRLVRQKALEMTLEEYRESVRRALVPTQVGV